MRFNHIPWIIFSGLLWLAVGIFLLSLGLNFVMHATANPTPLILWLKPMAGSAEQAGLILILIGLMAGFLKGRLILAKTATRVVKRILSLEAPLSFSQVYSPVYFVLIGGMVLLGMSLRWLHFPEEIRGAIDVAIGSALINGAVVYFRLALETRKQRARL